MLATILENEYEEKDCTQELLLRPHLLKLVEHLCEEVDMATLDYFRE